MKEKLKQMLSDQFQNGKMELHTYNRYSKKIDEMTEAELSILQSILIENEKHFPKSN